MLIKRKTMKFKAKRSLAYTLLYALNIAFVALLTAFVLITNVTFLALFLCAIMWLELVVISILFFVCSYTLTPKALILQIGFVRLEIDRLLIIQVTELKKFTLNFSLSLNCLELKYGESDYRRLNRFYISPKKQEEFIGELKKYWGGKNEEN